MSAVYQTVRARKSASKASMTAAQDDRGPTGIKHMPLLRYQRDTIALPAKTPVNSQSAFKLHVPAAQCDTIRSWLCVNQTMTAWLCRCLACCHSLVANRLPRETGNWFSCPPVGTLLPSSCMAHLYKYSTSVATKSLFHHELWHSCSWSGKISITQWEWDMLGRGLNLSLDIFLIQ